MTGKMRSKIKRAHKGSTPSPKANDESVQNENVTNEDDAVATNEADTASESAPAIENEQTEHDQQEEAFESSYVSHHQENSDSSNHKDTKDNERSHTPELKARSESVYDKKRIVLKRSPIHRSPSPLEDGEIKEPQDKPKKITLKRSSNSNSDFINKIIINRRPSGGTDKSKKSGHNTEGRTHIVIARPIQPSKPIKLNRNALLSGEEDLPVPPTSPHPHRSWGKSDWLENLSATSYKIDVDTIKIVCPSVQFLDESEVKLEDVCKEAIRAEVDVKKRIVKKEEEKSDEESEKEKSEEEDSAEEQKKSEITTNPNIIAVNRKISIVDDTAAKLRPPPSPAKNPPSNILYITNLVRPFTAKQLRELLERTGKIKEGSFWTDRIKSKCYVQYESLEEAETTRNALHGVHWPIGNGKQLSIDYGTEEEMEKAKNPIPTPIVLPVKSPEKENREPELDIRRRDRERDRDQEKEERRKDHSEREWIKKEEPRRQRSRSRSRERVRKHSRRSYTPEIDNRKKHKKPEEPVPQKLMDDLFLKTKTTPSIYWQPLSPQEIATKQQQRLVRMEEHKRRIEENRGRFRDRERDRRGTFRRR
ncbi:apoptotic chromatin condensation inducer in the nucleus isoform X2 [Diabrotica virgifera virgifera]|uniref:Apoptotic chromatin condensation inducer in the nucleus-like isoform X2 n=1 Tax=Diabrotica virgifera virgifera TaxID=50390 RepID=A0A6P7F4V9_DIAVI|nr:apoptotic chromatin condensation inducer in the nucleus isoform X2 [Diabrotica virgifera virgifera]